LASLREPLILCKQCCSDHIKGEGVRHREAGENIFWRNLYVFEKRKLTLLSYYEVLTWCRLICFLVTTVWYTVVTLWTIIFF